MWWYLESLGDQPPQSNQPPIALPLTQLTSECGACQTIVYRANGMIGLMESILAERQAQTNLIQKLDSLYTRIDRALTSIRALDKETRETYPNPDAGDKVALDHILTQEKQKLGQALYLFEVAKSFEQNQISIEDFFRVFQASTTPSNPTNNPGGNSAHEKKEALLGVLAQQRETYELLGSMLHAIEENAERAIADLDNTLHQHNEELETLRQDMRFCEETNCPL